MYGFSRHAVATTVVGCVVVALAACTPGGTDPVASDTPEATAAPEVTAKVQPGDCLAEQIPNANGNLDADLTSVTDCGGESRYLVYAVADIAAEFLPAEGASEEDILAQRESITLATGEAYANFHLAARKVCSAEFVSQAGLDGVDVVGASPADVLAEPSGNFYTDVTASSEAEWLAGEFYFVCSLGWETVDKLPTTAVIGSSTLTDFFSAEWPSELRRCTQWVGDGVENVLADCQEPHWMEHTVQLDPWAVLGEDARVAFDVESPDEDLWLELDTFCEPFTAPYLGEGADPESYWSTALWVNFDQDKVPTSLVCGVSVEDSENLDVLGTLAGLGDGAPITLEVAAQ